MKIYAVKLDNELIKLDNLLIFISNEKINEINRFKNNDDKCRAVFSEILIRYVLSSEFNLSNRNIKFIKNEYGKPNLAIYENYHFNLSHSEEWVVCAIDNNPIGIDIEKIQSIDYKELVTSFYTEEERNFIFGSKNEEQLLNFYRIWTLKESYIKADGRGLTIPLKSFSINIDKDENIKVTTNNTLKEVYFKEFNIDLNYKMSICSLTNNLANEVVFMSSEELIKKYMKIDHISEV